MRFVVKKGVFAPALQVMRLQMGLMLAEKDSSNLQDAEPSELPPDLITPSNGSSAANFKFVRHFGLNTPK